MPFSIRPFRRFTMQCTVTYNAGLFFKLPLAYFSGFGLLITLLWLSSGPVHAEWVSLGEDQEGMTAYVDLDTIRRKGDLAKMWVLYDYKTIQTDAGDSYLSSKSQFEFDCAEERRRLLAFTWFLGNMGSGKVGISDSSEGKWVPIAPESVGQGLWQLACSKK